MIDDEGFDELYRAARPGVARAVFVVCGDAQLAGEATDEAFVRAYERWDRVGVMASPTRWVVTVALNVVRKGERRRSRRLEQERKAAALETMQHTPAEPSVELWDALRALPRRQREAVALRYLADFTEADVARSLGVRPGTVARLLHDARASLATQLIPDTDEESTRGPT